MIFENLKQILHPIVIHECDHRNDSLLSNNLSKGESHQQLLTFVTHLDANQTIDEKVIDQYATVGRKVMSMLGKPLNDKLDYHNFKTALELMNMNMLESRILSLFNAAAIDDSHCLSRTDLEIALMINDLYPAETSSNSIFEIFLSFDFDNVGKLNFEQFKECVLTLVHDEGGDRKDMAYLAYLFRTKASSGRIDFNTFVELWCRKLADVNKHVQRQRAALKDNQVGMSKMRYMISYLRFYLHRKQMLIQEMTKPGYDSIKRFGTIRKQVVDLRLKAQKAKDKKKRSTKALVKKQNRKTLVAASQRKKDMSLILRSEGKKTDSMMKGNRIIREKLLKDCEDEKDDIELVKKLRCQEKMKRDQEEIHRSSADRFILREQNLDEIPKSLYSDRTSQLKFATVKILDLSGNQMKQLPTSDFFFHFISARKLCFSRNQLVTIPDEISHLKNIEVIVGDQNYLKGLPACVGGLLNLQVLDLSNNRLLKMQDELCSLSNLRVLKLHSNLLSTISELIGNLKALQLIDLSNNNLSYLPDSFCSLGNLVNANISNNAISDLPCRFGSLQQLEYLDASFNDLHQLPDTMVEMRSLKIINLSQNYINEVGDYVEGFTSLSSFEGTVNMFNIISAKIGSLHSLIRLSIPNNQIKSLPNEIGLLVNLIHLNAHNNSITKLPVEIGAFQKLQSLNLSQNRLSVLPHEICLVTSLIWFDISMNNLTEFPKHFGELKNLKILNVSNNNLTGVSETFHHLKRLERLDLSSNFLQEVEIKFCQGLSSLQVLNLGSNRIRKLPNEISSMSMLKELNIRNNIISSLPLELTNSHILIDVTRNPMDDFIGSSGYTLNEMNNFMANEISFYAQAVDEWNNKKTSHLSGKLNFDDFKRGVLRRSENIHYNATNTKMNVDNIEKHTRRLKQFYFHCKKYGNPPVYSQQKEQENREREYDAKSLMKQRNERSKVARDKDMKFREEEHQIYYDNLKERCNSANLRFRHAQEKRENDDRYKIQKILDDVRKRMNEKVKMETEIKDKEKTAKVSEMTLLNAIFSAHENKKRYLPVELKACWKPE